MGKRITTALCFGLMAVPVAAHAEIQVFEGLVEIADEGTVALQAELGATATTTLMVTSTAGLPDIEITGAAASDYGFTALDFPSMTSVALSFTPGAAGSREAIMTITRDADSLTVNLAGQGLLPNGGLAVFEDLEEIPDQGTVSLSAVAGDTANTTLTVTGFDEAIHTVVPPVGAAYGITALNLPNGTMSIAVSFSPDAPGPDNDRIEFAAPDGTVLYTVFLAGEGLEVVSDCNANQTPDEQDIAQGDSEDCNDNGMPDECEGDDDQDGVINDCDRCPGEDDGHDADGDGTPDCLQDDQNDCNQNGFDDAEDLEVGDSEDCNDNGMPDECEGDDDQDGVINDCDRCPGEDDGHDADGDGTPDCLQDDQNDCNQNGSDDAEDLEVGDSEDCNDNGMPDECESDEDQDGVIDGCDACPGADDRRDADGNGVADCIEDMQLCGAGMTIPMMLGLMGFGLLRQRRRFAVRCTR